MSIDNNYDSIKNKFSQRLSVLLNIQKLISQSLPSKYLSTNSKILLGKIYRYIKNVLTWNLLEFSINIAVGYKK